MAARNNESSKISEKTLKVKGAKQMKATGIVRKTDDLGRFVFPIELRRDLKWAEKDQIEIWLEGAYIVLRREQANQNEVGSVKRRVDELGRVVIPVELRRRLKMNEKQQPIEIFVQGNNVYLKPYVHANACAVTGEILAENRVIAGLTLSPLAISQLKKELAVL